MKTGTPIRRCSYHNALSFKDVVLVLLVLAIMFLLGVNLGLTLDRTDIPAGIESPPSIRGPGLSIEDLPFRGYPPEFEA